MEVITHMNPTHCMPHVVPEHVFVEWRRHRQQTPSKERSITIMTIPNKMMPERLCRVGEGSYNAWVIEEATRSLAPVNSACIDCQLSDERRPKSGSIASRREATEPNLFSASCIEAR